MNRHRTKTLTAGHAPPRRRRDPSGFTLLEVLLAVSLSLLLLVTVYAALKMHLTFAQRGPEQVLRAQKARGILKQIAHDVRAVIPSAPKADTTSSAATGSTGTTTGSTTGSGSQAPSTTGSSSTDTTGTSGTSSSSSIPADSDAYRAAYGVLGGTDWLMLYIAGYDPNLDDTERAASSGSIAQTSNVVRVTYALALLNTQADKKGRTQRMALTRSEVASIGAERADMSGDDSDFKATTQYLCDDVAQVQFQYWDDLSGTWLDSWGVDIPMAPPRAIKVFISLLKPDEYVESQLGLSGNESTWQPNYQMVIPISTWVPDSESSSSSSSGMTGGG